MNHGSQNELQLLPKRLMTGSLGGCVKRWQNANSLAKQRALSSSRKCARKTFLRLPLDRFVEISSLQNCQTSMQRLSIRLIESCEAIPGRDSFCGRLELRRATSTRHS